MTDVVSTELALDPILSLGERTGGDGGIVDQDVNVRDLRRDLGGGRADGVLAGEVALDEANAAGRVGGVDGVDDRLDA